jgi:KamA family protein
VRSALTGGDHITRHPLWVLLLPNERESGDGIEWPRSEPSPQKGLLSFYGCTVDLVVTSACPVNCRMCTRRNVKFPGVAAESLEAAIEYIAGHATVRQVVLTGGDALMLDNDRLFRIIDRLRQVEHLHSIRIATRALAAVPMRISHDPELLAMLQSRSQTRPVTFVHTFFAHPDELTPECRAAVAALQSVGVVVYNSTVLSRGINDSYPVLSRMVADMCEMRVVNHHLFQCDVGQGLEGFWVPLDRAHQLYRRLYLELAPLDGRAARPDDHHRRRGSDHLPGRPGPGRRRGGGRGRGVRADGGRRHRQHGEVPAHRGGPPPLSPRSIPLRREREPPGRGEPGLGPTPARRRPPRQVGDRVDAPLPRLYGRGGVLGRATGIITRLDDLAAPGEAGPQVPIVLVTRFSRPEIYAWASCLAAVVALNGSRLCHLASLLRANRPRPIPYLYGLQDIDAIPPGGWGEVVVSAESGYLQPLSDGRGE